MAAKHRHRSKKHHSKKKKKKSSKKRRAPTTTSSSSSSSSSTASSSSSSSSTISSPKPASNEMKGPELQHRSWATKGPVYIGETYQDPKDGTIIKVVRTTNRSRLHYAEQEFHEHWPKIHYCCKDPACYLCADYRRTTRANLCLSVVRSMRKVDKPNGAKFKKIVDDILRTR